MGAMKKPVVGHIDCPTCGYAEMQVSHDKNEHAFGFCPDCTQQLFTRTDHKSKKLMARMRPVAAAPIPAPAPAQQPAPQPEPAKTAPEAKKPAQPVQPTNPPKKTAPAPATQAGGWFKPLLGSAKP